MTMRMRTDPKRHLHDVAAAIASAARQTSLVKRQEDHAPLIGALGNGIN